MRRLNLLLPDELASAIFPIKKRLCLQKILNFAFFGFAAGEIVGIATLAISWFFPIVNVLYLVCGFICFGTLVGIIYAYFVCPSIQEVAKTADKLGLQERIITAIEFAEDNSDFVKLQREDTVKYLQVFDPVQLLPLQVSSKCIKLIGIISICLIAFLIIPSPMQNEITHIKAVRHELADAKGKVEKLINEAKNNDGLQKNEKERLLKDLKRLQKELDDTSNEHDAIKVLSKTEEKLQVYKKLSGEQAQKDLDKIVQSFMESRHTQKVADRLKNGDFKGLQQELKQLNNKVNMMSDAERQAFAKMLAKAAANIQNTELAMNINQLANTLQTNAASLTVQKSLDAVAKDFAQMLHEASTNAYLDKIMVAIEETKGEIAKAAGSMLAGNSIGEEDSNLENGKYDWGKDKYGKNEGNSSEGNIRGGHGELEAGTGSTNRESLGGASGSSTASQRESKNRVGEYERIYVPTRLGGEEQQTSQLHGQINQGTSQFIDVENSSNSFGELVPYNLVIGEYSQRAIENLERQYVPPVYRQIVKDYFSGLE